MIVFFTSAFVVRILAFWSQIDDKAMVEQKQSEGHFDSGDQVQYLTPALMTDFVDEEETLVFGRFVGFLKMPKAEKSHAMVFDIFQVAVPNDGCWRVRSTRVPTPGMEFMENLPQIGNDAPYNEEHPLKGGSLDDHSDVPEDQVEGHRPLEE
jgi:hypothetical protein